jgi:hypothetical protein
MLKRRPLNHLQMLKIISSKKTSNPVVVIFGLIRKEALRKKRLGRE